MVPMATLLACRTANVARRSIFVWEQAYSLWCSSLHHADDRGLRAEHIGGQGAQATRSIAYRSRCGSHEISGCMCGLPNFLPLDAQSNVDGSGNRLDRYRVSMADT